MSYEGYRYGIVQAARLARALGVPAISAAEFGVAGGNGLVALEAHALATGMPVTVAGFDTGKGLPEPQDHRDLPYAWQAGQFAMDEAALRARTGAELVLGDAGGTLGPWLAAGPPPLGFLAFDMDYYSSTIRVLDVIGAAAAERFLPRVWCYFDDIIGHDEEIHSEFAGELLAIAEFNEHASRKIAPVHGLGWKIVERWKAAPAGKWMAGLFVLHLFDHPRYCEYVMGAGSRQMPLRAGP